MTAKVTATVKYGAPYNESFPDSHPYTVTLRYQGRRMTVPFYTGLGWTKEPTATDVMECLLSDASSADQDFESWASDYGYDVDGRKAEKTYRAVVTQTAKLRKLLGADFEKMLYPEFES